MTEPFYKRNDRERRDVEQPAIDWAFKRGWTHIKVTSPTKNALPDDLFIRRGEYRWWEFKGPDEEPKPQQAKRHRDLRAIGCHVHWTNDPTLKEFKEIMR